MTASPNGPQFLRMRQLWAAFEGFGLCGICALTLAVAKSNTEYGGAKVMVDAKGCRRMGEWQLKVNAGASKPRPVPCFELARPRWGELPPREDTP